MKVEKFVPLCCPGDAATRTIRLARVVARECQNYFRATLQSVVDDLNAASAVADLGLDRRRGT